MTFDFDPRRAWVAAVLMAMTEMLVVFVPSWSFFLTADERWRFVLSSICLGVSLGMLGQFVLLSLSRVRSDRRLRWVGAGAFASTAAVAWLTTDGRRVRDAAWRPVLVVVVALVVALTIRRAFEWWATAKPRWRAGLPIMVVGCLAIVADAFVLPRLYPAFHWGLAAAAWGVVTLGASLMPFGEMTRPRVVWGITVLLVAGTLGVFPWLQSGSNVRFVVRERAPLSGKVLGFWPSEAVAEASVDLPDEHAPALAGVDLRDQDVLLITVDALRADRLRAYGGSGLTPQMDALADESKVFLRAYTPTPHTSYALTSLLTGKFIRPVLELPDASTEHPALPELLRQYGYRTAAFYPPAIFFVDAHRFRELAGRDFGFEYRKVMFAPAHARVRQLERYLGEVEAERPVFAWVHLFEPHEPYEPPERFRRGTSRTELYDGEVAAADDAVGRLVETFRSHRPGATVIVSADHGEELGDHGGWYHGTTLYDEQIRVPLLWSSPGVVAPGPTDRPVEIVDIATTLLAAMGIPRDARMRGDDLGSVLRASEGGPRVAFAEIGAERMAVNEAFKLICGPDGCRLFDLLADPAERHNVADAHPDVRDALRTSMTRFIESIPRVEAMAVGEGAWPPALARAELGDGSLRDVVPLLGDARAPVRAAAARVLGKHKHLAAASAIARLRDDADETVRREAVLSGVELGDGDALDAAASLLEDDAVGDRAALALLDAADARAFERAARIAQSPTADERDRARAIQGLGRLSDMRALAPLREALGDVRLRPEVLDALSELGGREAADIIAESFANERYLEARRAAAVALFRLRDARAVSLTRRFLGVDTPFPGAVELLVDAGAVRGPGGAVIADQRRARGGEWDCTATCTPLEAATVRLPGPPRSASRAVWWVEGSGRFVVDGVDHPVEGRTQISIEHVGPARWSVGGDVAVLAMVLVPQQDEIPPPEPEPWQPGEPGEAGEPGEGATPPQPSPGAESDPGTP